MNTLHGGETPEWNNDLIKNLSFIKKKLRYPFTRQVFSGSFLFAILITFGFRLFALTGMLPWSHRAVWIKITVITVIALLVLVVIFASIVQLIKFVVVPTPFLLADNLDLLEQFMNAQHLAFFRHPEAPEVFQIISKNITMSAKREQREVMVFIADNNRILVNSHFTKGRFTITPPSKHYRQMANRLKQWITIYYTGGTQLSHNKF